MKNGILVTARTASTRLPKKALIPLYRDVTLLEHILRRAKNSKLSDQIILCTTQLEEDKILCDIAIKCGVNFYQGSVEDKLGRWNSAVKSNNLDYFVTMDGDDPFCAPELIDNAFQQINSSDADFIEKVNIITGLFTYAITASSLEKVCNLKDSNSTEMMWTYFKDTGLFNIEELTDVSELLLRNDIRLTIDYPEDLKLFKKIFEIIPGDEKIDVYSVVELLSNNTLMRNINYFRQNEFIANQKAKTLLKLKVVEC